MPIPVAAPRVNNNDDSVTLTRLFVRVGERLHAGDPVAEVTTEKAAFVVDTRQGGFVTRVCVTEGQLIDVGSVIAWLGESADDIPLVAPVPSATTRAADAVATPTVKAQMLLARHGIAADDVPYSGHRLTAGDVEQFVATQTRESCEAPTIDGTDHGFAPAPGSLRPLSHHERGMARTVAWQRSASPAYVEIKYDSTSWVDAAERFQAAHQLLFNPMLSLMAWNLARMARLHPDVNATLLRGGKYVYDSVNVGFAVQADVGLYLVVVHDADTLSAVAFCERLGELQLSAMRGSIEPTALTAATVGFSSMARWNVSRHVPLLAPFTSVMVAHTAPAGPSSVLGASYDHRTLDGATVVEFLMDLANPPVAAL